MVFTKEIINKLFDAFNSETEQDQKVVAKVHNVAGPGVFYALEGWYERNGNDTGNGKFTVYGLTNIDFSGEQGSILEEPVKTTVIAEDFDTFNIPYGHVLLEVDGKFSGRVSDAMNELNA